MKPLIIINFKNYKEAIGDNAIKLASKISKVKRPRYDIIISPTQLTVREIAKKNKNLKVIAQHSSMFELGAHTGSISINELKSSRVKGTLLNHSERKLQFNKLSKTIEICKKKKFITIVCASTISEIRKIATLKPDYIAYEPKSLIGTNISVTTVKPEIIVKAVEEVKKISRNTKVLCGAGIHSKEDIGQALLLGTHGVLLAHAVVQAKNPKEFLEEMLI